MNSLIIIADGIASLHKETVQKIAEFEKQIKKLKDAEEEIKKRILEEMEQKNIRKIETDYFVINYIDTTDRQTFDTKAFRRQYADLFDEFVKLSPVKPSIRITLKK